MYRGHTVGVVVPAYNEEGFVGDVIDEIPEYVDRIYAVDDASADGTWTEIREAAARLNRAEADTARVADGGLAFDRRVVPIQHEINRGAGGALKTGYRRALEDGVDVTSTLDADGQMDPDRLTDLLDPIVAGEADYTKGNRLAEPAFLDAMPRFRLVGNVLLSFLTKIASGYWQIADSQNGYTAISHDALEAVDIQSLYEYYGYCNELLVRLNIHDMRVADVAMPAEYGDEESSIDYTSYIPKVSGMLFRNFLSRLKKKYLVTGFHPLALFYLAGIGTLGLTGIFLLTTLVTLFTAGSAFVAFATTIVTGLFATLFVLLAISFDHAANEHLEVPA
ncbi:glycosyltransferase family 2 protein [Haladaptatus sp. DJG-WS-42]|uniref:glycosyltransferase family 2 protein n=1 Tax=Haladaptatus sp. DJG-WS-42 TaxID=3120516 RepID=UPI0030CDE26E